MRKDEPLHPSRTFGYERKDFAVDRCVDPSLGLTG